MQRRNRARAVREANAAAQRRRRERMTQAQREAEALRNDERYRQRTVGRIGLLARHGAKNNFLKRTILLHHLGRKMFIPHIWCMDAP